MTFGTGMDYNSKKKTSIGPRYNLRLLRSTVRTVRQVRSTRNRRACMNVDEARGLCMDRSRWRSVISAYPHGKKA